MSRYFLEDKEPFYIPMEIVHVLPFTNSKKRVKDYDRELEAAGWGSVKVKASEELNSYDAKVFMAVAKLIYDKYCEDDTIKKKIEEKSAYPNEKYYVPIEITAYKFLKHYMHLNPQQYKHGQRVWDSLIRLSGSTWEFTKHGITLTVIQRVEKQEGKKLVWVIYVGSDYLEKIYLYERGNDKKAILRLYNKYIQMLKGNTAILLCIFLQGQLKRNSFRFDVLKKVLHLEEDNHGIALRNIKRAFNELKRIGFISDWEGPEKPSSKNTFFRYTLNI